MSWVGGWLLAMMFASALRSSQLHAVTDSGTPLFDFRKCDHYRQASDFVIVQEAWTRHGLEAFDDPKFEYTKHWMASYLLAEGNYFAATGKLPNGKELVFDRAFHTGKDYYTMGKGEPEVVTAFPLGVTHGRFLSLLGGPDAVRLAVHSWSKHPPVSAIFFWPLAAFPEETETVTTFCGLYDVNVASGGPLSLYEPNSDNIFGTPPERASTLVHEAIHAHYLQVDALDHVNCGDGQRNPTGGCDRFYPHPKSGYVGGDLYKADAGSRKLPPYEIEYEYLCDLLDQGKDWVPLAVLSDAAAVATRIETGKFVGAGGKPVRPPFLCGTPAPMMARPASAAACGTAACSATMGCSVGICDEGCCVDVK